MATVHRRWTILMWATLVAGCIVTLCGCGQSQPRTHSNQALGANWSSYRIDELNALVPVPPEWQVGMYKKGGDIDSEYAIYVIEMVPPTSLVDVGHLGQGGSDVAPESIRLDILLPHVTRIEPRGTPEANSAMINGIKVPVYDLSDHEGRIGKTAAVVLGTKQYQYVFSLATSAQDVQNDSFLFRVVLSGFQYSGA